jgi:hypothetical protein
MIKNDNLFLQTTGIAMDASKRLQVNIRILPDFGLLYPKVIPDLYIPIAWIEEVRKEL